MENEILSSSSQDMADSWASVTDPYAEEDAEDLDEWEQIMWPLRPMTCSSPPLSFATVQWDAPDPAAEMSFVLTDGNVDDEVSAGSGSPPLPHHQEEERGDGWTIDLPLLHAVLQRAGSDSEVGWVWCGVV